MRPDHGASMQFQAGSGFGGWPGGPEAQFLQTRTVLLFGEVSPAAAQTASQQLLLLAAHSREPVRLIINAQGGTIETGEALFDLLRGLDAPVTAIGAGGVANAAALAFAAPPLERRVCLPHARFSLYQHVGAGLDHARFPVEAAHETARQRERFIELLARQTGQPPAIIDRDSERQVWLSAEEALAYGLVGAIVPSINQA